MPALCLPLWLVYQAIWVESICITVTIDLDYRGLCLPMELFLAVSDVSLNVLPVGMIWDCAAFGLLAAANISNNRMCYCQIEITYHIRQELIAYWWTTLHLMLMMSS